MRTVLRSAGALIDVSGLLAGQARWQTEGRSGELATVQQARLVASTPELSTSLERVPEQPRSDPQMFAIVDATDPRKIYYHGIDVGDAAFTVRCNEPGMGTNFGKWISMQTAYERLDRFAGPDVHLALVVRL